MQRADATKDNMGLTAFEGAKVRKKDVDIAKNYLNEEETSELNRVVTMYLDFAEDQARRCIPMYMKDWEEKLNSFLNMNYDDAGFKNEIVALPDAALLANIREIQQNNNVKLSGKLINNLGRCSLDVEMETGTGKTYVYIKTMYELKKDCCGYFTGY